MLEVFVSEIGINKFFDSKSRCYSLSIGSKCCTELIVLPNQVRPDKNSNWFIYPKISNALVGSLVEVSEDASIATVNHSEFGPLRFYKIGVFAYKPYALTYKRHGSRGHLTLVYDFNKAPGSSTKEHFAHRGSSR